MTSKINIKCLLCESEKDIILPISQHYHPICKTYETEKIKNNFHLKTVQETNKKSLEQLRQKVVIE